jgi:Asp-tRNA(Asn)/Glu-tRNA(Gln) amidotransferase A subunit family amidase
MGPVVNRTICLAPCRLTATETAIEVRARRLSVVEVVSSCIERIEALDPTVHAFAALDPEIALRYARRLDERLAQGFDGPLLGVPVGVKDVFNTLDYPTEMGSPIWSGFTPGNDARAVFHLKQGGAIVLGKTVTAEFAVHHPGPTVNPHNAAYSPGTSSSGSAVAVATCMTPVALGTQTAGSTIRPASYCGVFGFKPSFGLVPRTGVLKTLDTLDHVAFFARSVDDLALTFETARVKGSNHPFVHREIDLAPESARDRRWNIALVHGPVWAEAEPYAQSALLEYAEGLRREPRFSVRDVELPASFRSAHDLHEAIYSKALSYYFRDEYESHCDRLSAIFRDMVERGMQTSADQYRSLLAEQSALVASLDRLFEDVDVVLTLSTAGEAPFGLHGRDRRDTCLIWTMCHAPAISLPLFTSPAGLPYGAQIVARRYGDRDLLQCAATLMGLASADGWTLKTADGNVSV